MNLMAVQLNARLRTIAQQRNEREAILSSMSEGVLALDASERIVSINHAAADLLGLDSEEVIGNAIYEVARIPSLQEFVEKALRSPDTIETEISLPGATERSLQAHGTVLHDSSGERAGVVLVFSDITRLKKLENIRRDFVANVSHELKTPITAITGSTETLLGGALSNPDDSRRFLEMIARHSDRLNNLVDDLLSLARIESEAEQNQINLTRGNVIDVLQASIRTCQEKSSQHNVSLTCSCETSLEANINPEQLEQAISNLIHNAIKHSDDGSTVSIEATTSETEVVISVRDSGTGIAAEHHTRLFERFYRVDQARSRQEGGTGLGLAIVKHIALVHGGRVGVESSLGKGSTFSIYLPALQ
jgi:two-component system phosphate regulon sensor histidine kinase PhoR